MYTKVMLLITSGPLHKCVVVTVYADTLPSACILIFCLCLWSCSGRVRVRREKAFPPANDSAQVRLRALWSTATGRHSDRKKL